MAELQMLPCTVYSNCCCPEVSLSIPCHRAVGTDGKLHGYRWGLDRKQALLELEGIR